MNLLICDRIHSHALARLTSNPDLNVTSSSIPRTPSAEELRDTDILFIRSGTQVDSHLIHQSPNLKFVVTATSGFDHIDISLCLEKSITACYCPEANAQSAAEHTIAILLSLLRNIPKAHKSVGDKKWRDTPLEGLQLFKKTLGIVGLGRVGQRVAQMASGFNMEIVAYDPYIDDEIFKSSKATKTSLDELFRLSDYITLHIPYTRETHHMIHKNLLSELTESSVIVNTSRGSVIRESDLLDSIESFRGAALDVFEKEPLAENSSLINHPKIIHTPHIGALTEEAFYNASQQAAEKILQFLNKKPLENKLPPTEAWYAKTFNKHEK